MGFGGSTSQPAHKHSIHSSYSNLFTVQFCQHGGRSRGAKARNEVSLQLFGEFSMYGAKRLECLMSQEPLGISESRELVER
jgi:hypothetical protein